MRIQQNLTDCRHAAFYFLVLFLLFLIQSQGPLTAQAETLVPLHVQKGTNLIHIARQYCSKQSDWKTIAIINHLKSPYIIYADSTIRVPLSILLTEEVSAKVAAVSGSPLLVTQDFQTLELQKADLVLPGQTVMTEEDEYVHLVYPDHKHTRIGPQSEMTLVYLMRLTDANLKAEFSLKKGRIVHSIQQKLKANEHFETRTPVAITGIRGTEFRLKMMDSETNIVETLEGQVTLSAAGKQLVLDKGKGAKVKKGQPPAPPRKLPAKPDLPHIEEVYRTLPVIIGAPAHEDAKSMRLRITADKQKQDTLVEQIAQPGQNFTLSFLADGHYHAYLSAMDNEGFESLPSGPVPLYVRTIPAAPIISSPNSGLKTFDAGIKIRWLKSELAQQYNIQLATDPDFSVLVAQQQTKDASFTTAALDPGTYFFRVQTVAEDGFETLFSVPLTWKVVEQPKLDSMGPAVQGEDGIKLQWSAMADMSGYMLQVAHDKKFNDLIVSEEKLTESSYTITDHLSSGDYYVRMCAFMDDGRKSPWTQTLTMTIDAEPLGMKHVFIALGFIGLILL